MKLALVGKAGAGKTTILNALTGANAAVGAGSVPSDRTAALRVPDERLEWLAGVYRPKKITPTTIDVADLGGLGSRVGGPRVSEVLAAARDADALVLVVRAFTEPTYPYPRAEADPQRDLSDLVGDLVFADLAVATKRVERLEKEIHKPTPDRDRHQKELAYLGRVVAALEAGAKVRTVEATDEERKLTRGYGFLTDKPWILLVNRGEGVAGPFDHLEADVAARAEIAGRLELELGELDEEERAVFMQEMGVDRLHAGDVIAACYRGLDVVTYFTCGPTEVRSWTLRRGGTALEAAANVHSDLARGFIRAEVMAYADLREHGSEREVKAAGKFRLEGKTYVVAEGDVILIRFSV